MNEPGQFYFSNSLKLYFENYTRKSLKMFLERALQSNFVRKSFHALSVNGTNKARFAIMFYLSTVLFYDIWLYLTYDVGQARSSSFSNTWI